MKLAQAMYSLAGTTVLNMSRQEVKYFEYSIYWLECLPSLLEKEGQEEVH